MPTRLTALILVPTIVGVLLASLRVVTAIDSVAAYQRNAAEAVMAGHLRDLGMQLGLERDMGIWSRVTRQQATALEEQRRAVDAGIATVRQDLAEIDDGYGLRAAEAALQVGHRLDQLPVIRAGNQPPKYTDLIASILRLHDEITQMGEDPELVGDARGLSALAHAKEEASQQRGMLIGTLLRQQRFTSDTLEDFIAARSRQRAAMTTFNAEAGADNGRYLAQTLRGTQVVRAELTKSWAIALASRNLAIQDARGRGLSVRQWFDDITKTIDLLRQVEGRVSESLAARASVLESGERRNAIIAAVLILALVVLVLTTTVLIARSLVRPLRRLRSEALEIAGFRLPAVVRRMRESGDATDAPDVQPILIGSHDEIGEVATAFDEVHRQALRLAAEESQLRGNVNAMFVNLSRRIQTLVERQISLIDGLERGEQDGGRLADLFKLDHLATRMRRNSENLLVLAGHEATRKRSQPAKLVDVVRASLSEVEDYERVNVKVHRSAAVAGHAANDVVHLVAELVENALAFSPGNTRVVVSSSMIEGGGALLAVSDAGIGMTPEEIADINRRLADPPVVDVSVSRRMGLFVVGRLALRHGIRVQLRRGDSSGLIAMVLFPPQLISVVPGRAPAPGAGDTGPALGGARGYNDGASAPSVGGPGAPSTFGGRLAPFGEPTPTGPLSGGFSGASGPTTGTGPLGSGTGPVGSGTGPVGSGTGPIGPGTGPLRTGPLGSGTGPVGSGAGPLGPGTGPVGPGTGPTGHGTGPLGPGTGPVGPGTGPLGPGTGPVGPATGPARQRSPFEAPSNTGPVFGPVGPSTDPSTSPAPDTTPPAAPLPPLPTRPVPADRGRPGPGNLNGPGRPGGPARLGGPGNSGVPGGAGIAASRAGTGTPGTAGPGTGNPGTGITGTGSKGTIRTSGSTGSTGSTGNPGSTASGESPLEQGDEYLPIFAAVESAWFRRPDAGEVTASRERVREEPQESVPATAPPEPGPEPAAPAWGSQADTGWRAADAVKDPAMGGITAAGLPKRTPKANLVPGSVGGAAPQPKPTTPAPRADVSADLVRARMSRFQQGIRRGRADISQATARDSEGAGADGGRAEEEGS
ncbi:sensor histidine kinase [Sphaerisporangium siamense]|uniref:histidine kinase n=1 Tax=Sphaerisporangium siamense TaxID=795645 RepID=A0A7W7DGI9_9ACTN|nr:nitrate- and nitrite sensing domain-containing protein [Sphaerisporangium siamense]MBB4705560.1 signal transduction histidine kinase [Sphaerisporangium siamense]